MKVFAKLDNKSILSIEGPDAARFLQGQLSCDVIDLNTGENCLGAFCSAQGRMHGNFRLYRKAEDSYLLQLETSIAESFCQQLGKYAVFSKAEISLLDNYNVYAIEDLEQRPIPEEGIFLTTLPGIDEYWGESDLSAMLPKDYECTEASYFALKDIENGIAWVQAETVSEYLPQMFNWDLIGGVNFKKGCYTGQEIVARAHYRGKVKRRLFRGVIEAVDSTSAGGELYNDVSKAVASVASTVAVGGKTELLFVINNPEYLSEPILSADGNTVRQLPLPYEVDS